MSQLGVHSLIRAPRQCAQRASVWIHASVRVPHGQYQRLKQTDGLFRLSPAATVQFKWLERHQLSEVTVQQPLHDDDVVAMIGLSWPHPHSDESHDRFSDSESKANLICWTSTRPQV